MPALDPADLKKAFGDEGIEVYTDSQKLKDFLLSNNWKDKNLLMMTSGNFGNLDLQQLADTITAS
jgi:UDP-N-acetylmuramate: L-alanyl-gamma-D-glutamyl-meso-diaminopimelate ligase